ncbi:hypothetical protein [Streptomyces griseoluteus]|uniref:hypothetical protein n=1 Tax=Streptomyces griseoluteus TaxID=29306 RepID=UPI0036F7A9E9
MVREITEVALGFPPVTFTAALVLVVGFRMLILLGPHRHDRPGRRMDVGLRDVCEAPVIAAASLVIAVAWIPSLGGSLLLRPREAAHPWGVLLAAFLLVASLTPAALPTRLVTRMWRRLHG